MADVAFAPTWTPTTGARRPVWFDRLAHSAQVLRRRARRNRYLARTGRASRGYPWLETLFTSMSGR